MPESEAIAVYGYLTQPEIRFLDAAVLVCPEHPLVVIEMTRTVYFLPVAQFIIHHVHGEAPTAQPVTE